LAFTRVVDLIDQMVAENVNQYAKTLEGDAGAGRPITLTALSDAVNYALSVANQDGTNGRAVQVYKADLVNKWLDITKNGVLLDGIQGVQTSGIAAPGAGKAAFYPKSDGHWYLRAGGAGAETEILDAGRFVAAGDLPYGSAAGAAAILTLGTKGYGLLAGATAPVYDPVQRRNRIINGDFRVWQRGASAPTTADNAYGPDRWRVVTETTATGFTINRESTDVPAGGSRYAAKLTIGASNNTKNGLFTILEGVDMWDLRGQAVSLQFKMKVSDARIGDVRVALVNWTGTEDATSADPINVWGAAGTNPTYTGSWANVNTPANLSPTTSWATYKLENQIVSASATNLAVFIWIDDKTTTAGDYLLEADVQLEKGAICTDVERRPLAVELELCKRYAEWLGGTVASEPFGVGLSTSTNTVSDVDIGWLVTKRVAPTITLSAASDFQMTSGAGALAGSSFLVVAAGVNRALIQLGHASLGATNVPEILTAVNTSARIKIEAEL
jgi:hypothetical protein